LSRKQKYTEKKAANPKQNKTKKNQNLLKIIKKETTAETKKKIIYIYKKKKKKKTETNFDGSDTKTTGLEKQANTTGGDSFSKTTNYSTRYQHVLHVVLRFTSTPTYINKT
jgi:hypothetical protein